MNYELEAPDEGASDCFIGGMFFLRNRIYDDNKESMGGRHL